MLEERCSQEYCLSLPRSSSLKNKIKNKKNQKGIENLWISVSQHAVSRQRTD